MDYQRTAELLDEFGSPLYVYDAEAIADQSKRYERALKGVGPKGCKNYFAVKALPNPHILKLLRAQSAGFDCSSIPEIHLVQKAGGSGEEIIFTSNNTNDKEFDVAVEAGVMVNFDDLSLVKRFLAQDRPVLPVAFCRYNPGDIEFDGINQEIIGKPSEAKYGMPHADILDAYRLLRDSGVKRFGLHTMLLSNERDYYHHLRIAKLMFEVAKEISDELDISFEAINLGGGFGVAYVPGEAEFDIDAYGKALSELYTEMGMEEIGSPQVITENGRWVTADAGYLLTKVINRKDSHRSYIGVDANMANLMRPGMYDAYHHIEVLSDRADFDMKKTEIVDVVGSLCENNDKFAKQRSLPVSRAGDIAVICTTGAHGHAMGFQYNGMLRSAEVLLGSDGPQLIRRAETEEDYFRTLV